MRGLIVRAPKQDERGAVLVLVAASMVFIMALAALTIDLGNGWRSRRGLIPATDAAALAAAQSYVNGENGCSPALFGSYLTDNWAGAENATCQRVGNGDRGYVIVQADSNVDTWFAGVFGGGDYRVDSHTAALYAPPDGVTGLRPIGLCFEGSAALQGVVNNPPATNTVIRVDYDKDQPDACGGEAVPGNWGVIDFDFGSNSNNDTKDWIVNGYPDAVFFENHTVSSCAGDPHCYPGDTGALAGINGELNQLRNSGIYFTLPVFNFVEGNGANAEFHLMGVLRVRLLDYQVNGNPNNRFFEFDVEPGLITGTCCGSGSGASGNKIIAICAVDPGDYAACTQ